MFSDIYKIREIAGGLCLEVEGKMVSRTEGNIDDSLIGGNASAEGPDGEGTESTVVTGVDIVMNHHLQETSFTKEAYKKYIKDYMKSIKGKLEEQRPERVKPFMTGAAEQIKHILANFKNYQFFIGANMNPDGMVALLDYREDGVTPFMIFFKDGLEMEKCAVTKFGESHNQTRNLGITYPKSLHMSPESCPAFSPQLPQAPGSAAHPNKSLAAPARRAKWSPTAEPHWAPARASEDPEKWELPPGVPASSVRAHRRPGDPHPQATALCVLTALLC
ncbi:Translationally-controlled tumor protein [Fukomys damarensis]|uniref:Translationally-controlled tumor protein n=3 Tax=Hystricomorpha TaxID=33550 RepID=A0A091DBK3_FUKDA|nr:Translationally-controlled tumor protein [Fukomys damarensis]